MRQHEQHPKPRRARGSGSLSPLRQAREELQETNQTLQALIEASPLAIVVLDSEGHVKMWNPAAESMYGWTKEEVLGRPLPSIPQDRRDEFTRTLEAELQGRRFIGKEVRRLRKDGSPIDISVSTAPLRDGEGRITGVVGVSADISERKRMEEALRRSELEYRNLFESANDAILIFEPADEIILEANKQACQTYGFTHDELVGMSLRRLTKDPARGQRQLHNLLREGRDTNYETGHFNQEGAPIDVLISSSVIEYGGREAVMSIIRDVTERKRAVEALQTSERRYRDLFENAPMGIYSTTPDGRILMANPALIAMLGYSSFEELAARNLEKEGYAPTTVPRSRFKEMIETEGQITGLEAAWLKSDRSVVFVRENARAVTSEDGRVLYYEGTVEDVTERKRAEEALRESEERYRSVIAALQEGIVVLDADGIVRACNAGAERILGIRAEQMVGSCARDSEWEAIDQDGRTFLADEQPQWYTLRTGQPRSNVVMGLRKPGGEQTWISINSQPLFQPAETRPDAVVVSFSDISERKLAEERLRSSREQLRALSAHLQAVREEERTRIAREIHDELGQSLTALKMDLSWLGARLFDDQANLLDKVRTMSALVDSTVQVVRRISTELRPGVLDDLGLTAAIEWQVQEFQNRTGVKCEFASDPEDVAVDQDRSTAVFRILQESLTNIARHAGASKVQISLRKRDGELKLEVRDNGRGITQGQASSPRSLGLIGMRERALLWGGKLKVSGMQGKGTRVTVRMPLEKPGEAVGTYDQDTGGR